MKRTEMISGLRKTEEWDLIIIGGGATGLGCAVEASSRGYKTLLLEQHDFGKGTSSRSTKLVHGGVRYLQQGNISLVLEALKERGNLLNNAPHLVHNLPFIVPRYEWWDGPFYGIGLKLYDMLAGRQGFGKSHLLTAEKTIELIPTIQTEGLKGGVIYYDGQFDDARLVICLAQTAADLGATIINYFKVNSLSKTNNIISGVNTTDEITGDKFELKAKAVINATGVFSDTIRKIDDHNAVDVIQASQGTHIVLDRSFLPGSHAIMVPKTDDGRILFAIPWLNKVIIGTTDVEVKESLLEPIPKKEEIEFLLTHAARYLAKDPGQEDILSVFSGLRPLVANHDKNSTAELSRDHTIIISSSGLLTIAGGKWTTYRKMAEDTIDQAAVLAGLISVQSTTSNLKLHGYHRIPDSFGDLSRYGSDAMGIIQIYNELSDNSDKLHPSLSITKGEIKWNVRKEMAMTVEDILARRTRCLLLDAKAALAVAQQVAEIIAVELNYDEIWIKKQVEEFTDLANNYIV
jgi:glycerol-3-phosphate dehydrogenase